MNNMSKEIETIATLRKAFIEGTDTPSAVLLRYRDEIKKRDGEVHAYLDVYEDALGQAKEADALYKEKGVNTPVLLGIPVAIKNNILIKGKRATAGSKILENYVAPYDATVIQRLKDAGALFVGATNLDEFAMGSSTENSAFGPTKNPHDITRVPGGSSGGSAAAVAMGSATVALGTDTGGSVRLPASYCGLVGFKPTYGAISRYGLVAMGSSLDQAGTFTNCVSDAETLFGILRGQDDFDMTAYPEGTYSTLEKKNTYRIGVPYSFLGEGVETDVRKLFDEAIEKLKLDGHEIIDISLPRMASGLAAYYIVMPAEVSSNLARYDGVRFGLHVGGDTLLDDYELTRAEGFGREVKRRILLGTYVLSAGSYDSYYGKAEAVRDLMREELATAFNDVDFVLTPTAPTSAFKVGEKSDPLSMYLTDVFTVPANLTGVPSISLPAGTVTRDGVQLPIGIQFMAPHGAEVRLFDIGKKFFGEE